MFKRIAKISGLVLLVFLLLIGGIVGVMAIRGDFKEQKVKPSAINFEIVETELVFDATAEDRAVYSFTIKAEPANVTEVECSIKLSNSSLITFLRKTADGWTKYEGDKFYLNRPIYFEVNDITEDNEQYYTDGILTMTVKDASGELRKELELKIDRNITSISFKDQGNPENNQISNGLFGYEVDVTDDVVQVLEAIIDQDYELEVITAPLKAAKPFANTDAKKYDVYYLDDTQEKLLYHVGGGEVELRRWDDNGSLIVEDCDFITYDEAKHVYIFNTGDTGEYYFRLATYPNYDIQAELENEPELVRLYSGKMVIKDVKMVVSGTDAEKISFNTLGSTVGLTTFQDNQLIANGVGENSLGLTLSKESSGTLIDGRYEQLKFLAEDDFEETLTWNFKVGSAIEGQEGLTWSKVEAGITLYQTLNGEKKAKLRGFAESMDGIKDGEYNARLVNGQTADYYELILSADGSEVIKLSLMVDESGNVLNFVVETEGGYKGYIKANVDAKSYYLDVQSASCLILGEYDEPNNEYGFKTLKNDSLYLAIVSRDVTGTKLLNDKFITSIVPNKENTLINIMPVDASLSSAELYAIVVNSNGSWRFTADPCELLINTEAASLIVNDENVEVPLYVKDFDAINYGPGYSISNWVMVEDGASYDDEQLLMFAPKFNLLTQKPAEWGNKGFEAYTATADGKMQRVDFANGATTIEFAQDIYYTRNNYKMIDSISIMVGPEGSGVEYFLLGYISDAGAYIKDIAITGVNYNSKIYPFIAKTQYYMAENRLYTAEEYINSLLKEECLVEIDFGEGGNESWDLRLIKGSKIYRTKDLTHCDDGNYMAATQAFESFDSKNLKIKYYTISGGVASQVDVTEVEREKWDDGQYYIKVSYYQIKDVDNDGTTLSLITNVISDGILVDKNFRFEYSYNTYKTALETMQAGPDCKLKPFEKADSTANERTITINTYYDLTHLKESSKQVLIGGDYFAEAQTKTDKGYSIIAGHKEITLGWDETTASPIGGKTVQVELTLDHVVAGKIFGNIVDNIKVYAVEYNKNGERVGRLSEQLIKVEAPVLATIVRDDKQIDALVANFEVYLTLNDGHYIKFEWVYNVEVNGETVSHTIYGAEQLTILSRNISGYVLDVSKMTETMYDGENKEYTGEVKLQVEIGWDNSNYTYNVVAVDANGNYLYKDMEHTTKISGTAADVFALTSEGGWIKADPFYANMPNFNVLGNSHLEFDNQNKITFAQVTDDEKDNGFVNITISSANGLASTGTYKYPNIPVKVVANGFVHNNIPESLKASTSKTIEIPNIYTHNTASIDRMLQLGVEINSVIHGGKEVKEQYKVVYNGSTIEIVPVEEYVKTDKWQEGNTYRYDADNDIYEKVTEDEFNQTGTFYKKVEPEYVATTEWEEGNTYKYNLKTKEYQLVDENEFNSGINFYKKAGAIASVVWDESGYWKIIRENYDKIVLDVEFVSVVATKNVTFTFESPYTIVSSAENNTTKIYSGTTFRLAKTDDAFEYKEITDKTYIDGNTYILEGEDYKLVDRADFDPDNTTYYYKEALQITDETLYTLNSGVTSGYVFTIKFTDADGKVTGEIKQEDFSWSFMVPVVEKETKVNFRIYFSLTNVGAEEQLVAEFELTILPNVIITGLDGEILSGDRTISLDDDGNNVYDLNNLKLCSYDTTNTYYKYTDGNLVPITDFRTIGYNVETYNDKATTIKAANIANAELKYVEYDGDFEKDITYYYQDANERYVIATEKVEGVDYYTLSNTLNIGWIENVGNNYYVLLTVTNTTGEKTQTIGNIKFLVESKWAIKGTDGQEVKPMEITANSTTEFALDELKKIFKLYRAGELADGYELTSVSIAGDEITSTFESGALKVTYDGFGDLSKQDYVDTLSNCTVTLIFEHNEADYTAVIDGYTINVKPYTANISTTTLLAGQEYVLNGDSGLFNADNNIKTIAFNSAENDNYTITHAGNKYTIVFKANGNNYTANIPVIVTYKDEAGTLEYNQAVTVINPTAVSINYPFDIQDASNGAYANLNVPLSEIEYAVNGDLDLIKNDLVAWLGMNGAKDLNNVYVKHDIALKDAANPTVINLTNDELLKLNRFNTANYELATEYDSNAMYYAYNNTTQHYELVSENNKEDFDSKKYFVKTDETANITKLELVAVSENHKGIVGSVDSYINLSNPNKIVVNTSLNSTGYLLFKVYSGEAYGYYVVNFINDSDFASVIVGDVGRQTGTISKKVDNEETEIIKLIIKADQDFKSSNVAADLINVDYSNVYLFMVNSVGGSTDGKAQFKDDKTFNKGELIPNDTLLKPTANTQSMTIAVVVISGASTAHICNYNIILLPDVEITLTDAIEETEDANYYVYKAKAFDYDFSDVNKNIKALAGFITIGGSVGDLNKITINESREHSDELILNNIEAGEICVEQVGADGQTIEFKTIATLSDNQITLTNPLGLTKPVFFYVTYTYYQKDTTLDGLQVHVRITINPISISPVNEFTVGTWDSDNGKFNNALNISQILGDSGYNKGCTVEYSTDRVTWTEAEVTGTSPRFNGALIEFDPSTAEYKMYLRVTFTGMAPARDCEVTVNVKPNISSSFVSAAGQSVGDAAQTVITDYSDAALDVVGSSLYVEKTSKTLVIKDKESGAAYLKYNASDVSEVKFTLQDTNKQAVNYLIDASGKAVKELRITESESLSFAHTAKDLTLMLNVEISTSNGKYVSASVASGMYIKLAQSYTLEACYRVDGATYETVSDGTELSLNAESDASIGSNFFGDDDYAEIGTTINEKDVSVKQTRLAIKLADDNIKYGYDNILELGLLNNDNPNYLNFSYTISPDEGTYKTEITIDKRLVFKCNETDNPTVTLTMTNGSINQDNAVNYIFKVMTTARDYGSVAYNDNLQQIGTNENGEVVVDRILTTVKDVQNGFELAYLNYKPDYAIDGSVGFVVVNNGQASIDNIATIADKISTDMDYKDYMSAVRIYDKDYSIDSDYVELDVYIVTMNGVSEYIKLVVTNIEVEKGYITAGQSAEQIFAGTTGEKLTATDKYGNTRLRVKIGATDVLNTTKYTFDYKGSMLGAISNLPIGTELSYDKDNGDVISYNSEKGFSTHDVPNTTYITMIFEVVDEGSRAIVGRVFYVLQLENALEIWVAGKAPAKDLEANIYLGNIGGIALDGNTSKLDLLDTGDNSLYIELKRKYYGEDGEVARANVSMTNSSFKTHLGLEISNPSTELENDKVETKINEAIININGNPAGSFTLTISSKSAIGYSQSVRVYVHRFDNTIVTNSGIDNGTGTGYESGKDVGLLNIDPSDTKSYAFNSYRLDYNNGKTENVKYSSDGSDDIEIKYQVAVFNDGTTVSSIIGSEQIWENAKKEPINLGETIPRFILPAVMQSPTSGNRIYQIVSVRLLVTYNGDTNKYFTHYRVYNPSGFTVNPNYSQKVITYGDTVWTSGKTLTLIGANGLYTIDPDKINIADYKVRFTTATLGESDLIDINSDGTCELPSKSKNYTNVLFKNQETLTIEIVNPDTGSAILIDTWTIKSNITIESKSEPIPLSKFFTQAEIDATLYNTGTIIGITSSTYLKDYEQFVEAKGGNGVTVSAAMSIEDKVVNGYAIRLVRYKIEDANDVFDVEKDYYVLAGKASAMSFDFNGGQYYINLTIDDANIDKTQAKINITDFITMYSWDGENSTLKPATVSGSDISVEPTNSKITYNDGDITLEGVDSMTSNLTEWVTITYNDDISRTIQLYFNIVIKAKDKALDGKVAYNADLVAAVDAGENEVTITGDLKKALLSLITFNNTDVDVDNSTVLGYYTVTATKTNEVYSVTYTYNNDGEVYTRTLQMAANAVAE